MKYDWNDISIVPAPLSTISSRKEINSTYEGKLPLFTAPMDKVIDETNLKIFEENNINICLPRHIKYDKIKNDNYFYSYGLDEIIELLKNKSQLPKRLLIDIANGHMLKLWETAKQIKETFGNNIELMVGNIANPETYRKYCEIGVDYIRVGIGGGCFTPDSLVMTQSGYKPIKDINIGDMVLTHKNRYKEVLHKFIYNKNEEIFKINDIKCTKNHEFYVIEKSNRHIVNDDNIKDFGFWIPAEELNKDIHLLVKY
jgi:hypothetical protein